MKSIHVDRDKIDVGDEVLVIPSWYIVESIYQLNELYSCEDDELFLVGDDGVEKYVLRRHIDDATRWIADR